MAVFRSVTPLVEPLSLDEAFLDVSGAAPAARPAPAGSASGSAPGSPTSRASPARSGWRRRKFVAKLASTRCKPDGLLVVPAGGVLEFLHPLPVGALWGVGERTAEQLRRLGLRTVGDLAALPLPDAARARSATASAAHLHELAWGQRPAAGRRRTSRRSRSAPRRRSTSTSTTRR